MTPDTDSAQGLMLSKTGYQKLENLVERYVLGSSESAARSTAHDNRSKARAKQEEIFRKTLG
jgi:hypothetical protein